MIPVLLEIGDGTTTLRLCNNTEDLSYGGYTYLAYPFSIDLHADADTERVATLVVSAVDPAIMMALRTMAQPITATAAAIFYDDGVMEPVTAPSYELSRISFTESEITATLTLEPWADNEYPADTMSPHSFPGLF